MPKLGPRKKLTKYLDHLRQATSNAPNQAAKGKDGGDVSENPPKYEEIDEDGVLVLGDVNLEVGEENTTADGDGLATVKKEKVVRQIVLDKLRMCTHPCLPSLISVYLYVLVA